MCVCLKGYTQDTSTGLCLEKKADELPSGLREDGTEHELKTFLMVLQIIALLLIVYMFMKTVCGVKNMEPLGECPEVQPRTKESCVQQSCIKYTVDLEKL